MSPVGVTATVSTGQLTDVATIGTILSPIAVGPIADIGTIGTLISGQVTASIVSGVITSVGSIVSAITATIESGVITSVGSIVSAVTATIESGVLQYVATIGTILFANVSIPAITAIATIGTIQFGNFVEMQAYGQTNILTNQVVLSGTAVASTLLAGTLQDLEVDSVYGTVVSGSVQSVVFGVEPQSNVKTSTIVSGDWYTGTVQIGQRIVALGPLGAKFVVALNIGGTSTILGVYLTAVQTTSS